MAVSGAPWYADAVIYGIDVEKFADGNEDGVGDFVGLTERIPYLRNLGITCVWLLPFFPSPNRDNGYDVSNYLGVDPRLGSQDDFIAFLHRAGEHGIRVIVDLVVNHTSDQHPWFQAARRDEKSAFRDYYVWSHDPPPVGPGEKSIFPVEETGVWTYDEVARAYYFHKFYDFQPELNLANEAVRADILRVVDYWLALGVSGFRVDAAPLLIGQNGLARADPKDAHGVLQELRAFVEKRRPDALLLGEANLPPAETDRYFGHGDQLGLLFNFMLPPYFFHALALEQAGPLHEALSLEPEPPPGCAWANFLRNLDDFDLSQTPPELQEKVFARFAPESEMRIFGRGIRRRLAPMLDGDQRRVELALSLVLSLRGAPVIVYGDEIGLGEDLSQRGRNSVRVPMQWTAGRNAGFSPAAGDRLVQKPVTQGPFGYRQVNVEAQRKDEGSLLNRFRRLVRVRRSTSAFANGRFVRIDSGHPAVFLHAFEDSASVVLIAHNLSGKPAEAALPLPVGNVTGVRDLLEGEAIDAASLGRIELGPYAHRWLCLHRAV